MKRFLQASLTVLAFLVGYQVLHATCLTPLAIQAPGGYPYEVAYTTGPNDSCYIYYVDKSGNVQASGNVTNFGNQNGTNEILSGYQAFTPSTAQTSVNLGTPVNPNASYVIVGSTFIFTQAGATAISTSTAVNGQFLIVQSTQTTTSISITTGSSVGVIGENATIVFSSTFPAVSFVYSSLSSAWVEIGKQ